MLKTYPPVGNGWTDLLFGSERLEGRLRSRIRRLSVQPLIARFESDISLPLLANVLDQFELAYFRSSRFGSGSPSRRLFTTEDGLRTLLVKYVMDAAYHHNPLEANELRQRRQVVMNPVVTEVLLKFLEENRVLHPDLQDKLRFAQGLMVSCAENLKDETIEVRRNFFRKQMTEKIEDILYQGREMYLQARQVRDATLRQQALEQAKEALKTALRWGPQNLRVRIALVHSYLDMGSYHRADDVIKPTLDHPGLSESDQAPFMIALGRSCGLEGRWNAALRAFDEAHVVTLKALSAARSFGIGIRVQNAVRNVYLALIGQLWVYQNWRPDHPHHAGVVEELAQLRAEFTAPYREAETWTAGFWNPIPPATSLLAPTSLLVTRPAIRSSQSRDVPIGDGWTQLLIHPLQFEDRLIHRLRRIPLNGLREVLSRAAQSEGIPEWPTIVADFCRAYEMSPTDPAIAHRMLARYVSQGVYFHAPLLAVNQEKRKMVCHPRITEEFIRVLETSGVLHPDLVSKLRRMQELTVEARQRSGPWDFPNIHRLVRDGIAGDLDRWMAQARDAYEPARILHLERARSAELDRIKERLKKALRWAPSDMRARFVLVRVYREMGHQDERKISRADLILSLTIADPHTSRTKLALAHIEMARLEEIRGHWGHALRQYHEALEISEWELAHPNQMPESALRNQVKNAASALQGIRKALRFFQRTARHPGDAAQAKTRAKDALKRFEELKARYPRCFPLGRDLQDLWFGSGPFQQNLMGRLNDGDLRQLREVVEQFSGGVRGARDRFPRHYLPRALRTQPPEDDEFLRWLISTYVIEAVYFHHPLLEKAPKLPERLASSTVRKALHDFLSQTHLVAPSLLVKMRMVNQWADEWSQPDQVDGLYRHVWRKTRRRVEDWLKEGSRHFSSRRFADAQDKFENAMNWAPQSGFIRRRLLSIYCIRGGMDSDFLIRARSLARGILTDSLAMPMDRAHASQKIGWIAFRQHRWKEAVHYFGVAIQKAQNGLLKTGRRDSYYRANVRILKPALEGKIAAIKRRDQGINQDNLGEINGLRQLIRNLKEGHLKRFFPQRRQLPAPHVTIPLFTTGAPPSSDLAVAI